MINYLLYDTVVAGEDSVHYPVHTSITLLARTNQKTSNAEKCISSANNSKDQKTMRIASASGSLASVEGQKVLGPGLVVLIHGGMGTMSEG